MMLVGRAVFFAGVCPPDMRPQRLEMSFLSLCQRRAPSYGAFSRRWELAGCQPSGTSVSISEKPGLPGPLAASLACWAKCHGRTARGVRLGARNPSPATFFEHTDCQTQVVGGPWADDFQASELYTTVSRCSEDSPIFWFSVAVLGSRVPRTGSGRL